MISGRNTVLAARMHIVLRNIQDIGPNGETLPSPAPASVQVFTYPEPQRIWEMEVFKDKQLPVFNHLNICDVATVNVLILALPGRAVLDHVGLESRGSPGPGGNPGFGHR